MKTFHRWTMTLSLNNNKKLTSHFINRVKYTLHPTYAKNMLNVYDPPFSLTRLAWGWFDVTIEITFQKRTGLPNAVLVHTLRF